MTAPERIALRWEPGAAVTNGPMMTHPDYTRYVREDVAHAAKECGDDVIRASNTLMLMLVGELPMTKRSIEDAVRKTLDARNAWDNANKRILP